MTPRALWDRLPRAVVLALAAVAVGFVVGHGRWTAGLTGTWWYLPVAGLLLGVGLYGSTHDIDRRAVARDLRTVTVVVTLGVLLKAAFIAAVMVLVFHRPEYAVLGIAVAQIDPLSVAAVSENTRMSPRAKSLLSVWAAFDDPMTVLLSVSFPLLVQHMTGGHRTSGLAGPGGLAGYAATLGWNLLLCAVAVAAWHLLRRMGAARLALLARAAGRRPPASPAARATARSRAADVAALLVVVPLLVVAAARMLMPAVALTGLVVRTERYRAAIGAAVTTAFVVAAFGLGVLLVGDVSLGTGVVLGLAAFAAQAVVTLLVVPLTLRDLPRSDTVRLAISQQNGITAIILALALEPSFHGTVGIVGPAILTIGVLYYASNAVYERHLRSTRAPSRTGRRGRPGRQETGEVPRSRERIDAAVEPGGAR